MKVSARRKSRYGRAASEFFHAGLAFLCGHCLVGSLLAPSLRLFVSGLRPGWVGEGAAADWTALETAGGAGWPSWTAGSALLAGGGDADKGKGDCFWSEGGRGGGSRRLGFAMVGGDVGGGGGAVVGGGGCGGGVIAIVDVVVASRYSLELSWLPICVFGCSYACDYLTYY